MLQQIRLSMGNVEQNEFIDMIVEIGDMYRW